MGLFTDLLKILGDNTHEEKNRRINEKLLLDEAKAYGLTKEEIEECKKAGITPEEWVNDNHNNK